MGRTRTVALAAAASVVCMLALAPGASARDIVVTSFDGTKIVAHFYPAPGLAAGAKAPTVLSGHGWGGSGSTAINGGTTQGTQGVIDIGDLHRAGYNVLTWDARGFGGSGGYANADGPDFEARDVMALIDYVAQQPEAQLDGPGDPRLGMTGSSYGGGIQLVTAPLDRRIDVIVPDIAWHSFQTALFKDHSLKTGWGLLLAGAGVPTTLVPGVLPGVFNPAGLQLGTMSGHIFSGLAVGVLTGNITEADRDWFGSRGPSYNVGKIRIPTLLTQGTVDTLFTLQEAIDNFGVLRGNGVPVKMMWHCGGHGTCDFPKGEKGHVEAAALRWLRRYLVGDETVDTGARFEWVDDKGTWHGSGAYPLTARPPVELASEKGGNLPLSPLELTGSLTEATPNSPSVDLPFKAPSETSELVGPPRVEFTYKGIGTNSTTFVYAQIVDKTNGQVLGNQITPLPVRLDGRERKLSRPLEPIAAHAGPNSKLVLQIIGGSLVYGLQRTLGSIDFSSVSAKLPVGVPVVATGGQAALRFGKIGRPRAATVRANRGKRFRLCARGGAVRSVSVVVKNRRGRVVGRSRRFNLRGCKKPTVRRWKRIAKGRYTVVAAGRDVSRNRVRVAKRFRLR